MNYQIPKEQRDAIIAYLSNSRLPYRDTAQIIQILTNLKEIIELNTSEYPNIAAALKKEDTVSLSR